MNGRRAVIGLCALCVLAISAIAAQGASAAAGTTAYTCVPGVVTNGTGFSKEHCKVADKVASGTASTFVHEAIPVNTTTNLRISNKKVGPNTETTSVVKLRSVRAGVEVELQATGVEAAAETEAFPNHMFNRISGEEMYVEGEGRIKFSGVKVTKPAGKGCAVAEETVTTRLLTASTAGLTSQLKFTPSGTEPFATFVVSGCSVAGLNGTYEVTGSIKGSIDGATTTFTHAGTTEQATLKLGGQNAGIEGEATFEGKAPADSTWKPLSVT